MKIPKSTRNLANASHTVAMFERMFPEIYVVGGAVRDEILGRKTTDLDFAVPYDVNEVVSVLEKNQLPIYKSGVRYKTIGTAAGGFEVQITTYRSELYPDSSRYPNVEIVKDIYSDLDRRDFTINAMALSKDDFVDPHNGIDDIKSKTIRSVLNAESKFEEDPLRILRAYRFVSVYGFNIEEQTLYAIHRKKSLVTNLPAERIGDELRKLLTGDYWSDAIFEIVESGVLDECLDSLGMTSRVITDNAFAVFDNYSSESLRSMNLIERWVRFIEIIYDAEKNSGASTLDISLTAEHLTLKVGMPKRERTEVCSQIESKIHSRPVLLKVHWTGPARSTKERLDVSWMKIREEKSLGKEAYFVARQYGVALKHFSAGLEELDGLYDSALQEISNDDTKKNILRKLAVSYVDFLGFKIASYILHGRLYASFSDTRSLERRVRKDVAASRLNKRDYTRALHEGIAHVYKENLRDSRLEDFESFIAREDSGLTDEKKQYLLRSYLAYCLKNRAESVSDKMRYNKKLAALIKKQSQGVLGLDYYDAYVNYLYYATLSTHNMDAYSDKYAVFAESIPDYISVAEKEGKKWHAQKRADLNSASCNVHALRFAESLGEKRMYARRIVEDYTNAGHWYQKNADRYQIYVDWFDFLMWVKNEPGGTLSPDTIDVVISKYKSYSYIDPDEDYLGAQLKEIAEIRDIINDVGSFAKIMSGRIALITDKVIDSIAFLFSEGTLTQSAAMVAFKNYILKKSKVAVGVVEVQIQDIVEASNKESYIDGLLRKGESPTLEFKSSWKMDSKRARNGMGIAGNLELCEKIVKTITGFMNTDGGIILIGVEDDGTVCGLEETDFLLYTSASNERQKVDQIRRDIGILIRDKMGADLYQDKNIEEYKYKGRTVLSINVAKRDKIVCYDGVTFIRNETETVPLTQTELINLMESRLRKTTAKISTD